MKLRDILILFLVFSGLILPAFVQADTTLPSEQQYQQAEQAQAVQQAAQEARQTRQLQQAQAQQAQVTAQQTPSTPNATSTTAEQTQQTPSTPNATSTTAEQTQQTPPTPSATSTTAEQTQQTPSTPNATSTTAEQTQQTPSTPNATSTTAEQTQQTPSTPNATSTTAQQTPPTSTPDATSTTTQQTQQSSSVPAATVQQTQTTSDSDAAVEQAQQATLQGNTGINADVPNTTIKVSSPNKPKTSNNQKHLWNLQQVDIRDVIEEVSRETGRNFLVDPSIQGKVTIISSTPLDSDEVYQLFLSILQTLGFATVPSGNVIKILPNDEAKQQGLPMVGVNDLGTGDQMVASVVPIKNVSAGDLVPILRPMMPSWANVSAYTPANSLIMTSSASNIDRMVEVIHRIDKATTKGIEIIPLHHANATKLVTVINTLQGTSGSNQAGTPNQVALSADEDNNSILLNGSEEGRLRMRALISQLDTAGPKGNGGNTKVVYLRYESSKKLAPILSKIAGSVEQQKGGQDNSQAKALIAADPDNNALIMTAPPTEMAALQEVIKQVDVRPSEVLVEAIIVQVNQTLLNRLGVIWGSIGAINGGTLAASGGANAASQYGTNLSSLAGSSSGSPLQSVLPYTGIVREGNLRIIASALQNDTNSNLLSTPDLMVLDNQKAKIEVGTELSIQSGSYSDTGTTSSSGSVTPFNTYSQTNVGLELDVTPHISKGGIVELEMSLENDTLQNPTNPGTTPIINTSGLSTSVLINSGDVLVLGGLISNNTQDTGNAIPWISNIPLIGWLFKFSTNESEKQNLMIFLRPVIVDNMEEGHGPTSKKYDYVRAQQLKWMYDRTQGTKNFPQTPPDALLPAWSVPKIPQPFVNLPPDYYKTHPLQFGSTNGEFPKNVIPSQLWSQ